MRQWDFVSKTTSRCVPDENEQLPQYLKRIKLLV
jgi:hypothetical protein